MDKLSSRTVTSDDTCHFVDPVEETRYEAHEYLDPYGQELLGEDEHGLWWGTERAAWVLSPGPIEGRVVRVVGKATLTPDVAHPWLPPKEVLYDGFFIGSDEEAQSYATCRGFDVFHVEPVD